MMTDPVADMLTRIRNAGRAGHAETTFTSSKMKLAVSRVLKEEGFIDDVQVEAVEGKPQLRIKLRYGVDGQLIDFGKRQQVTLAELVHEILELIDDVVDELEIRREVEYVHTILGEGTSADRQLAVYEKSGDLKAVVDSLIAETKAGC